MHYVISCIMMSIELYLHYSLEFIILCILSIIYLYFMNKPFYRRPKGVGAGVCNTNCV